MRRIIVVLLVCLVAAGAYEWRRKMAADAQEVTRLRAKHEQMQTQMQRRFPFESLRARLAYEQIGKLRPGEFPATSLQAADSAEIPTRNQTGRAASLRMVHHAKSEEFFRVPDNGFRRTPAASAAQLVEGNGYWKLQRGPVAAEQRPYKSDALGPEQPLELVDYVAVPPPDVVDYVPEPNFGRTPSLRPMMPNFGRTPSPSTLNDYFLQGQDIFCDPKYFGYIESVDRVAGFIPHEVFTSPALGHHRSRGHGGGPDYSKCFDVWRNTELQLVSLLKHPEPRV